VKIGHNEDQRLARNPAATSITIINKSSPRTT
jgi:hypothetical protein